MKYELTSETRLVSGVTLYRIRAISRMDGVNARRFWRDHKEALILLCRSRDVKVESKEEEEEAA